jgi:GMP synthase (glutamine-hydrolysing)
LKPVIVLRHAPHVPMGSLEDVLARAGVPQVSVDLFAEIPASLPLDAAAGLVILGGPMNVDEVASYRFLLPELDWIRQAVERELPTLGICLGAQLLAKALGKRVYRNTVKEIGWYEIEVLPAAAEDRLFAGRGPIETVFQWHGDTFDLPDGTVHLARGASCSSQAFRVGRSAYGVQFHVEMTAALIDEWLEEPHFSAEVAALDYIDPAAIRAQVPRRIAAMDSLSQCLLGRFAAWCRRP